MGYLEKQRNASGEEGLGKDGDSRFFYSLNSRRNLAHFGECLYNYLFLGKEVIGVQLTYIIALLFALVVAIFALLNAQPVTVDFMFNELQISLALVILVSAATGAIILGLLGLFRQVKENLRAREMNVRIKKLENQLRKAEEDLAIAHGELKAARSHSAKNDDTIVETEASIAKQAKGPTVRPADKTDADTDDMASAPDTE